MIQQHEHDVLTLDADPLRPISLATRGASMVRQPAAAFELVLTTMCLLLK